MLLLTLLLLDELTPPEQAVSKQAFAAVHGHGHSCNQSHRQRWYICRDSWDS